MPCSWDSSSPGEAAAILGGVAASRGNASLTVMCLVVVAAAIVGDTVGYEIGVRYGHRLLSLPVLRRRKTRIAAARRLSGPPWRAGGVRRPVRCLPARRHAVPGRHLPDALSGCS
jgi:hypothetical protein